MQLREFLNLMAVTALAALAVAFAVAVVSVLFAMFGGN